jgi:hypothetical protein
MYGEEEFPDEDFSQYSAEPERKRKDRITLEAWQKSESGAEMSLKMECPPEPPEAVQANFNAFDKLLEGQTKRQKTYSAIAGVMQWFAVVYIRRLVHIDPNHPLYGIVYIGQTMRWALNEVDAAAQRWYEEDKQAKREVHDTGLLAILMLFGDVFDNSVIRYMCGSEPTLEMVDFMNREEKLNIADHGGILKSMTAKCVQTLNKTLGGQGAKFEHFFARSASKMDKFFEEVSIYLASNASYDTGMVDPSYQSPSGYNLASKLTTVRRGYYWGGHPLQETYLKTLLTLRGWTWHGRDSASYSLWLSERNKKMHSERSPDKKIEVAEKMRQSHLLIADNTSARLKDWYASASSEDIRNRHQNITESKRANGTLEKQASLARQQLHDQMSLGLPTFIDIGIEKKLLKRQEKLESLSSAERLVQDERIAYEKARSVKRRRLLEAMRKLPGFEDATMKTLTNANKLGVRFSEYADSSFQAVLKTEGEIAAEVLESTAAKEHTKNIMEAMLCQEDNDSAERRTAKIAESNKLRKLRLEAAKKMFPDAGVSTVAEYEALGVVFATDKDGNVNCKKVEQEAMRENELEKRRIREQRHRVTTLDKRQKRLAALEPKEREKELRLYALRDRNEGILNALRKLRVYEKANKGSIAAARKAGVTFTELPDGEFEAKLPDQQRSSDDASKSDEKQQ